MKENPYQIERANDMLPLKGARPLGEASFFDNLPELMRPEKAASVLGVSKQTIYDWRYRQRQRDIPPDMFIKINRMLYVRTNVLKRWIALQNG